MDMVKQLSRTVDDSPLSGYWEWAGVCVCGGGGVAKRRRNCNILEERNNKFCSELAEVLRDSGFPPPSFSGEFDEGIVPVAL